jgi:hypothetical protein
VSRTQSRRWPSAARPSGSATQRSAPGAPPGSIRSTAGYGVSSAGPPPSASCCSATRTTPAAVAPHRHHGGLIHLAPRPPATAALPGTSMSGCWPSGFTPGEPRIGSGRGVRRTQQKAGPDEAAACGGPRSGPPHQPYARTPPGPLRPRGVQPLEKEAQMSGQRASLLRDRLQRPPRVVDNQPGAPRQPLRPARHRAARPGQVTATQCHQPGHGQEAVGSHERR